MLRCRLIKDKSFSLLFGFRCLINIKLHLWVVAYQFPVVVLAFVASCSGHGLVRFKHVLAILMAVAIVWILICADTIISKVSMVSGAIRDAGMTESETQDVLQGYSRWVRWHRVAPYLNALIAFGSLAGWFCDVP